MIDGGEDQNTQHAEHDQCRSADVLLGHLDPDEDLGEDKVEDKRGRTERRYPVTSKVLER